MSLSLSAGLGSGLGPWADALIPASWRGIPFSILNEEVTHGRRTALHQYPFRDESYNEDLGLGPRRFTFSGFLIGDDVLSQADALDAAVDTPNAGTLIHPALGQIFASLVSFTRRTTFDRGRVIDVQLAFVEQGSLLFPTASSDTGSAVDDGTAGVDQSSSSDFTTDVAGPIGQPGLTPSPPPTGIITQAVAGAIGTVEDTVGGFTGLVTPMLGDAAMLAGAVTGMPGGYFGRYAGGALGALLPVGSTVSGVLAAGVGLAAGVSGAIANVIALAQAI